MPRSSTKRKVRRYIPSWREYMNNVIKPLPSIMWEDIRRTKPLGSGNMSYLRRGDLNQKATHWDDLELLNFKD